MAETSLAPFKVIIAGGGITGLTLANALERAGIDYILLEKRDIAPNVGQSIFVLPCTSVIFEQLGIADTLQEIAFPLRTRHHWDSKMKLFCSSDELWRLYKVGQRPARFVDRFRFLSSLANGVQDKSKIRTHEGIVSFAETDHGVTVRTDKGNVYEGSILVGADGVHSEVRNQVASLVRESDPKASAVLARGFKCRFACVTAMSWNHFADDPGRPFLADGLANNSYHDKEKVGGLSCAGVPGQLIWTAYVPLEGLGRQPCEYPSPRFGQEDVDLFMARYGHLRLCPDYTINDVYESRIGVSIISMEENVLPTRWRSTGGRTVLLGDAVHKATANLGMGGNLCIDDVVRLMNGLVPLLEKSENGVPATQELAKVFKDYEKAARPRARFVCEASAFFCGFETMTAWYARLMQWVFPFIPASLKMRVFSIFDSAAPTLGFLPVPVAKFEG